MQKGHSKAGKKRPWTMEEAREELIAHLRKTGNLKHYPAYRRLRALVPAGVTVRRFLGSEYDDIRKTRATIRLINHLFEKGTISGHPSYDALRKALPGVRVGTHLLSHGVDVRGARRMVGLIGDLETARKVVGYIEHDLGILQDKGPSYLGDYPSYMHPGVKHPGPYPGLIEGLIINARILGQSVERNFGIRLIKTQEGSIGHRTIDSEKARRLEGPKRDKRVPWFFLDIYGGKTTKRKNPSG